VDVFQTRLAVQISITSCFLVPFLACKVLFSAQGAKIELVIDRRIDFHEKSIFCLSSWVRHESPNKRQRASEARFGSDPFQQISQGKRDHDWPNLFLTTKFTFATISSTERASNLHLAFSRTEVLDRRGKYLQDRQAQFYIAEEHIRLIPWSYFNVQLSSLLSSCLETHSRRSD